MKFTLSWLRTHLDTEAGIERIAETLSAIGLEVEEIVDPGAAFAGFRVARIATAEQHPNADRLRLCRVDVGEPEPVQVVCGAPNARAGLLTVFAPPGVVIPATGAVLKVGAIRGVESRGMLCSLRELGLGEDHQGIAELAGDAPAGVSYAEWAGLDDPVIDIAVTPNRGDALAVRGVARDLAAAGLGTLRPWSAPAVAARFPSPLGWTVEDRQACPWVLGRTIRGVRNGPSPDWLQRRLRSIGLRPISALVDITNFFTFDLGRPLHVFDADRVEGGLLTIRGADAGERFEALNGQIVEVTAGDCVIADSAGVQSLAGIMGGARTGSRGDTTSVFVECALFDPVRVARTGRRIGLATDARARFERGIDPSLLPAALDAATSMIIGCCGGEASEVAAAGEEPVWRREASMRFERLAGLGGLPVEPDLAVDRLRALGFEIVERSPSRVQVVVPPWRNDVAGGTPLEPEMAMEPARTEALGRAAAAIEAECDLIEEVLRLGGLDAVPAVSLPVPGVVPRPVLTEAQTRLATARRALATRGLAECVSFSFLRSEVARLFATVPEEQSRSVTLLNPIASDLDRLRPTPLASLMLAAGRNAARGEPDTALFEIGAGFTPEAATIGAGLRTGRTRRAPGEAARDLAWSDARADAIAVLAALGVPLEALTTEHVTELDAAFHPGRAGLIKQGPRTLLARFGTLHPGMLQALGFEHPAAGFEIMLDAIAPTKRRRRASPELPTLQPVRRDFAFVVAHDVSAEALLRAARTADRKLIASASLFDVYEGDKVPAGTKSLAIEVVLQPRQQTLTDTDIDRVSQAIVTAVQEACGATLRA